MSPSENSQLQAVKSAVCARLPVVGGVAVRAEKGVEAPPCRGEVEEHPAEVPCAQRSSGGERVAQSEGTHHLPSACVRQGCRSLSLRSAGSSLYSREKVPSLLL
jgi:hypothetical protein